MGSVDLKVEPLCQSMKSSTQGSGGSPMKTVCMHMYEVRYKTPYCVHVQQLHTLSTFTMGLELYKDSADEGHQL